ncbi:hypothetical protein V8C42DRAFT_245899 [Trichoderma barbatum]
MACRWKFPQRLRGGHGYGGKTYSVAGWKAVLLSVSLWAETTPMVFIERPCTSPDAPEEEFHSPTFEADIVSVFANNLCDAQDDAAPEKFINEMVYDRWTALVAEMRPGDMDREMLFDFLAAVEQNLEQARYLTTRRKPLRLADVQGWREILRRLQRRASVMATGGWPSDSGWTGEAAPAA